MLSLNKKEKKLNDNKNIVIFQTKVKIEELL